MSDGYKRFAVYDKTTGEILRTGTCLQVYVQNQANGPNEVASVVTDEVRSNTHKVDLTGATPDPRPMTDDELQARPALMLPVAIAKSAIDPVDLKTQLDDLKRRVALLESAPALAPKKPL